jgi:hypothetical protein
MPSPYDNPGGFGPGTTDVYGGQGMGLYDLFNTFQHINTLFGDTVQGNQQGLEAYDIYGEDLLRKQYREDYRSMVGDITQFQRDQSQEMSGARTQGGKAGFAGSGGFNQQMHEMQKSLKHQQKKMTGGLSNRRQQLLGDIQGQRQDYETGLWNAYSTWLSQEPTQVSEWTSQTSSDCLDAGGYTNSAGSCIMPGYQYSGSETGSYFGDFEDWMQS